jgi:hypothetical protein
MKVSCTKAQAATRQLDEAIILLFADHDPLAIRTLASAAHGIFADIADIKSPNGSWRKKIILNSGLSRKVAVSILNSAQNYLKPADFDSDDELSFDEEENDHVIFVSTLECCEFGYPLSFQMQVFQVWYLASYPGKIGKHTEPVQKSVTAFPINLNELTREERLKHGAEFTNAMRTHYQRKIQPTK